MGPTRYAHFLLPLLLATAACTVAPTDESLSSSQEFVAEEDTAVSQAAVTDQELNILRLHFVSGTSQEKLGELYNVHRVTMARWLTHARERLLLATQRELQARLKVDAEELHDILALLRSQLAISLTRALS